MAENKTKATEVSVDSFIKKLPADRHADIKAIIKLMESVSRQKPKMWGSAIIGFGSCHYRYESGREGDMPLLCFSPRKSGNVVYGMGSSEKSSLEKLGKHKLSGSCLHIARLADVDAKVLKTLLEKSLVRTRAQAAS